MLIRYVRNRLARMRRESLEAGLRQGRNEGLTEALIRQLELKFGPLPDPYLARLRSADEALLLRWSERVLMAVTLAAVFEGAGNGVDG